MRVSCLCTLGALGAGLALVVHPVAAAPVTSAGPAAEQLLHRVHGDHRECRWGYVEEWDRSARHRHRRNGDPAPCREDDDRDRNYDRDDDDDRTCVQVGPLTVCP
jgi:hypothetical protein